MFVQLKKYRTRDEHDLVSAILRQLEAEILAGSFAATTAHSMADVIYVRLFWMGHIFYAHYWPTGDARGPAVSDLKEVWRIGDDAKYPIGEPFGSGVELFKHLLREFIDVYEDDIKSLEEIRHWK